MQFHLDFETLFLLLVSAAGLFSLPVLLTARHNRAANRILAAVQVVMIGSLVHNLLLNGGIYQQHPNLYFLPVSLRLALGPLLWAYVRIYTGHPLRRWLLLHLLPVLAIFGFECWAFTLSVNEKWQLWQKIEWWWDNVYFWSYQLQLLLYLLLALRELGRWRIRVENQFSDTSRISLRWLRLLLGGYFVLAVAGSVWQLLADQFEETCFLLPSDLIRGALLLTIGWFSIRQVHLQFSTPLPSGALREAPSTVATEAQEQIALDIPTSEPLAATVDETLLTRIREAMHTDRLFLDPELNLYQLARRLAQPAKLVSATINRGTGQTFQAFVNSYRVQEVTRRLEAGHQQQLTLLAIAFESGFNSKSTFNRVFREQTGKAPGDFVPISS